MTSRIKYLDVQMTWLHEQHKMGVILATFTLILMLLYLIQIQNYIETLNCKAKDCGQLNT